MRFCLLIQTASHAEDDNYLRVGRALVRAGHHVLCAFMDSLQMSQGTVNALGFALTRDLEPTDALPQAERQGLAGQDVVWVLSLGARATFLDKMQMLRTLGDVRIINSLDALMHLRSKYFLASMTDVLNYPETHAATNPDELHAIIRREGGKWVAKPPAGSLGRDVFLLHRDDANARAILQHLCGPEQNQYALLQRYVEEAATQGEKRVLIADGEVVGQYLRLPCGDHRTNVSQGAHIKPTTLTADESQYCKQIGKRLRTLGAIYCAIDLAYPWVIEFNVVNPGGLATLDGLEGIDHGERVAELVTRNVMQG